MVFEMWRSGFPRWPAGGDPFLPNLDMADQRRIGYYHWPSMNRTHEVPMSGYRKWIFFAALLLALAPLARADELDDFARDFWAWRAIEQPLSTDDIPRLERPAGWLPDWSPATVARRRTELTAYEARWRKLDASRWPIPRQVDYRLIGSALARVRWELDINPDWRRNPSFYVDQTLGAVFDRLLQPPPFDDTRSQDIVRRMASIPRTLEDARANLDDLRAPFAKIALDQLDGIRPKLLTAVRELKPFLRTSSAAELESATAKAITALESYRAWIEEKLPSMSQETAVGREAYLFFLSKVALLPFTPEQLLAMGRQEMERAVAFETYEKSRNYGLPQLALFPDLAAQIARGEKDELAIRRFLEDKNILTIPAWMQHYTTPPLPLYVAPLSFLGVLDDLTSPTRLKENGVSYRRPPSPDLDYFALSIAKDTRPLLVHEGIPGHYFQLALSWAHEDPIRRHFYDSGANEGIGFYAEEMLLQAGLFDDSPRTREIIYSYMRLRALRVEVDVKLATGQFTIPQAAEYLAKTVPMDHQTALGEAVFFATGPGQAISYQIGKLQILAFLAEARLIQGEKFSLRKFHDFVWLNGNVPIALQRWEFLGSPGDLRP